MTKGVLRSLVRVVVVATALLRPASLLAAEDFYEQQLRLGKADMLAGRTVQASDELRIAAFGFLDRPPLLVEALVRLTLAQNTLSHTPAASQTMYRFLEVERRFSSYATSSIEPQTRKTFEDLLLKTVPHSDLTGIPALARLVRSDAAKVADLPADKRSAAYEAGFRRAQKDIEWPLEAARDSAARGLDEETARWARRALAIAPNNEAAKVLLTHAVARRGDCRTALAQIAEIPAAALQAHVELIADQVVCLTKQSRWTEADAAAQKLNDSERSRADVARALQEIAARKPPVQQAKPKPAPPVVTTTATANTNRPPSTTTSTAAPANTANGDPPRTSVTNPPANTKSADALAAGKALVQKSRFAEATRLLQPASAADPANRELRIALLEAACLAGDWRTAVSQLPATTPFKSGEEASMFYAAAALFENGRKDEARQLMARARPRLPSTPMVEYYLRLVLGSTAR